MDPIEINCMGAGSYGMFVNNSQFNELITIILKQKEKNITFNYLNNINKDNFFDIIKNNINKYGYTCFWR